MTVRRNSKKTSRERLFLQTDGDKDYFLWALGFGTVILNNGLAMEYAQNTRNTKLDFELAFLHIQFAVAAA